MENSNVDFSYKDSSIGGFPFSWKISIKEPRIALISRSAAREISAEKAEFCFDYDLNSVSVSLPEAIEYNFNRAEAFYNYSLLSEDKVTAKVSFIDSLYKIPGDKKWTTNYIKTVDLRLPDMKAIHENEEIFYVSNSNVRLLQDYADDIDRYRVKVSSDYRSDVSHIKINKAHLLLDFDYIIRNNSNFEYESLENFDHKFSIKKFLFRFDNASLDVAGSLKLARSSLPDGKIKISMMQYRDVVDFVVPEDFIISRSYIKKVIAKSTMASLNKVASNDDDVKFEINFSDKGILIGNLNLLELNLDK
ncbi:MAG: hypothetical protein AAF673_02890 [Pseudomonadota bacterium]